MKGKEKYSPKITFVDLSENARAYTVYRERSVALADISKFIFASAVTKKKIKWQCPRGKILTDPHSAEFLELEQHYVTAEWMFDPLKDDSLSHVQ